MCSPHSSLQVERERETKSPIKCMRSPHTSYRWRGESHSANQVYGPPHHHQLQVERVIVPIKWMRSPHTSYRWRGERRHRANPVYVLTTQQYSGEEREPQSQSSVCVTPHTPATGGEERVHSANSSVSCCAHHTPAYRWRGRERHEPIKMYALHHTPATGGEERERQRAITCMRSPPHQLTVKREKEVIRANQVSCARHTPAQVERRESHRGNSSGIDVTTHTSYTWRGGEESLEPIKWSMRPTHRSYKVERRESHRANQVELHRSPHSSYRWRGQRDIDPIKCM